MDDALVFLFFVVVMLICLPILIAPDEDVSDYQEFGLRKFSLSSLSKCNGPHQWTYNKQKTILQCKKCGTIAGKNNDRE